MVERLPRICEVLGSSHTKGERKKCCQHICWTIFSAVLKMHCYFQSLQCSLQEVLVINKQNRQLDDLPKEGHTVEGVDEVAMRRIISPCAFPALAGLAGI